MTQMTDHMLLLRFTGRLRIAHHIPGRVRLKLAEDGISELLGLLDQARRFLRSVAEWPGIRSVNFNAAARSCVVEYDPAQIPPTAWQDLVAGKDTVAVKALMRAIAGPDEAGHSGHPR